MPPMRYIELFSGSGGGILAHSVLHRGTIVTAAEQLAYGQAVLQRRQADGILPRFPIFPDVQTMDGAAFRGIDMLAGGFPCQGISAAGRKRWLDDPRSAMIWHMLRIADECAPRYIFAENSPNLRTKGLHLIIPELQRMGYNQIAWCVVGAGDMGAYHERKRMWVLAKRGGPPFLCRWGEPSKIPACGRLIGSSLERLSLDIVIEERTPRPLLPTLLCSDARGSGNRPGPGLWSLSDRLGITLKAVRLKQLPTLAATDWKAPYSVAGLERQLEKRSKPLRDMLPYLVGGPGKAINPLWAEWFMGWPLHWTDINIPLSKSQVADWRSRVQTDSYWSPDIERLVLPPTLPSAKDAPHQKNRITALGNGQVPVVAATVFDALRRLLG